MPRIHPNPLPRLFMLLLAGLLVASFSWIGERAAMAAPEGLIVTKTTHDFATLEKRVAAAIKTAGMLRVYKASASKAAKGRGITIPGDSVYGVYRNDFAVRMIEANPLAGQEAPIVIHVMEQDDGTASLAYKTPSSVFAPYNGPAALTEMAKELDTIFAGIVAEAAAP